MTSENAKVLEQRLKKYRELKEQLDGLDKQLQRVEEESRRAPGYSVCFIKFTRFNVVPGSQVEVGFETSLGVSGGGSVINDRDFCAFLATQLRLARDLVFEQIKKIPDTL